MRQGWPRAEPGMVIGLLGGSFDPAHAGHAHITREAIKRLGLDRVWWLVSPGNPLKPCGPAPMPARLARARHVMGHPRVIVTDLEARLGTRHTAQTLRRLRRAYPNVRFVWLMGADNLIQFHRWDNWQRIAAMVPIAVMARPGAGLQARNARAARVMARDRVAPARLARAAPPAWGFLTVPMVDLSSSAIRARGDWRG
ncbi:MAG: nicotinate-nucleotide adenylyltransferase [Rhodobacterales bacterium]|nr:nicotinate-nucleotide adenylyltransferase [Rhodobacterales bacterium]